jgi:GNAT superfamily N-acetyltransferase
MSDDRRLEVVRLADLRDDTIYDRWEGGNEIGRMEPVRRQAFLANPLSRDDDDPVQLIVTIGERAVARFDMFLGEVSVAGERVSVMWGSDLFVDPDFRKRGLGLMVSQGLQDIHPVSAVCGVSARSRPIFWKLGWTDFHMPRHMMVRRSRPIVQRFLSWKPAAAVAAGVADAGLAAHRLAWRTVASRVRRGLRLEPVDALPADLDSRLAPGDDRVTPHRSAAWINWLAGHFFEEDPSQERRIVLVKDGGGETVAYFVTKSRFHPEASQYGIRDVTIASLQDWRVFDTERLDSFDVALLAMESLGDGGADAVEVCMPDERASRRLAQYGFPGAGALNLMFHAGGDSPLTDPDFHRPERWLMRPAEGDNFFT